MRVLIAEGNKRTVLEVQEAEEVNGTLTLHTNKGQLQFTGGTNSAQYWGVDLVYEILTKGYLDATKLTPVKVASVTSFESIIAKEKRDAMRKAEQEVRLRQLREEAADKVNCQRELNTNDQHWVMQLYCEINEIRINKEWASNQQKIASYWKAFNLALEIVAIMERCWKSGSAFEEVVYLIKNPAVREILPNWEQYRRVDRTLGLAVSEELWPSLHRDCNVVFDVIDSYKYTDVFHNAGTTALGLVLRAEVDFSTINQNAGTMTPEKCWSIVQNLCVAIMLTENSLLVDWEYNFMKSVQKSEQLKNLYLEIESLFPQNRPYPIGRFYTVYAELQVIAQS